jgi:enoyl-CoA hydratase/carnithine racemase
MSHDLDISIRDRVQTIRLTRAEKKNALTASMYAAMTEALAAGDALDEVAAHVMIGSGGVFTAGNDISDFLARSQGQRSLGGPVVEFIRNLPRIKKPMIAAVDGLAVGVGVTLLLHCDLVYATPSATFRTPFLDLGLVPEAGSSLIGPRLMGPQRAFELLVLGETFTAERAMAAGFVNAIVAADKLEAHAISVAKRLAAKPPGALAASRRLLRGDPAEIVARIDEEVRIFAERMASPEAREAFQAFLEKRQPDFAKLRPSG